VFREYDIRGIADRDFPDEFVGDLGRAIGTHLRRGGARRVGLGRDCRLHSERLRDAIASGLVGTGLDVIDVGVPLLSMHAPVEIVNKRDLSWCVDLFQAFFESGQR
jgi:phosphomannomutase